MRKPIVGNQEKAQNAIDEDVQQTKTFNRRSRQQKKPSMPITRSLENDRYSKATVGDGTETGVQSMGVEEQWTTVGVKTPLQRV